MRNNLSEKILVIAAHPDDETLGCGGSIAKFKKDGAKIRVIFLAEGITARYDKKKFSSKKVINEIAKRNKNAVTAISILGVPKKEIFFSKRHCCRLDEVSMIDIVKEIEFHIYDFKPSRIFTHSEYDSNIDHRIVLQAVLTAARPLNPFLKAIYSFEVLSSTEWNPTHPFQAQVFFDISKFIDVKIKAIKAYKTEMKKKPHSRSKEVVLALAQFRGAMVGVDYAEGFKLVRSLDI